MKSQLTKLMITLVWIAQLAHADINKNLWLAVQNGNLEECKNLIAQGADIDSVTPGGDNALTLACFWGHLDIVRYLCEEKNVDINHRCTSKKPEWAGATGILLAAMSRYNKVVKYLATQGANLSLTNKRDKDVIMYLALQPRLTTDKWESISYILRQRNATLEGSHKPILLYSAINDQKLDIIKYLIEEKNVGINQDDHTGIDLSSKYYNLAIISAAEFSVKMKESLFIEPKDRAKVKIFKYLLGHGANLNTINKYGISACKLLIAYRQWSVINEILKNDHYQNQIYEEDWKLMLRLAAADGKLAIVKHIIEKKRIDPTSSLEIGQEMIANLPGKSRKYKNSAMDHAIIANHRDIVYYLREKDVPIQNLTELNTHSIVYQAIKKNNPSSLNLILELTTTDQLHPVYKQIILNYAIQQGSTHIVKHIIEEKGGNINEVLAISSLSIALLYRLAIKRLEGSPLLIATRSNKNRLVEYLLNKGAIIDNQDEDHDPFTIAAHQGFVGVMKQFIKYKDQNQIEQDDLNLAIAIADEEGHTEMSNYLKSVKLNENAGPTNPQVEEHNKQQHDDQNIADNQIESNTGSNRWPFSLARSALFVSCWIIIIASFGYFLLSKSSLAKKHRASFKQSF
ncbi:MAG: ankyrin repeat domain-containing protein [Bacteroidota bacterium]